MEARRIVAVVVWEETPPLCSVWGHSMTFRVERPSAYSYLLCFWARTRHRYLLPRQIPRRGWCGQERMREQALSLFLLSWWGSRHRVLRLTVLRL